MEAQIGAQVAGDEQPQDRRKDDANQQRRIDAQGAIEQEYRDRTTA